MANEKQLRLNDAVNYVHQFKGRLCAAYVTELIPGGLYGIVYNDPDYDTGYKQMPATRVRYSDGREAGTIHSSDDQEPTDTDQSILDPNKEKPGPQRLDTSENADKVVK